LTQLRDNGGRVARFTYDPAARLDSVLILPAGSGTPLAAIPSRVTTRTSGWTTGLPLA